MVIGLFFLLNLFLFFNSGTCKVNKKPLNIRFNSTNNIMIKGSIDNGVSSKFIYDLSLLENKKNVYVYLDTPGGSIDDGMQIVAQIKKYKLSCIAEKAYSMGFIIFQSCEKRYIMPHTRLMQHQLSYGIRDEKLKIDNYVKFIDSMEKQIVAEQAERIGIDVDEFYQKTINEWWLYGNAILYENCADRIVNVECSVTLTKQNYTEEVGSYIYTYSKCPLVDKFIYKNKTSSSSTYEPFIFTL
jgi:ATP-dependent Clp protease protease subunit|tara:strand:+ start:1552 stop:2277 length:726 start_codon:yes stop_codon:yes gene_type:complete